MVVGAVVVVELGWLGLEYFCVVEAVVDFGEGVVVGCAHGEAHGA